MKKRIIIDTLRLAYQYLGKAVADGELANCAMPVEKAFKQVGLVLAELEGETSNIPEPSKTGVQLIATERERQMSDEGWNAQHDDEHINAELARVGAIYALPPKYRFYAQAWPETWNLQWWKPTPENRIRELTKAGALIAAEIDRLQRVEAKAGVMKGA